MESVELVSFEDCDIEFVKSPVCVLGSVYPKTVAVLAGQLLNRLGKVVSCRKCFSKFVNLLCHNTGGIQHICQAL